MASVVAINLQSAGDRLRTRRDGDCVMARPGCAPPLIGLTDLEQGEKAHMASSNQDQSKK